MKLILENWRKYVQTSLLLEKQVGDFTVGDLEGLLQLGRTAERDAAENDFMKTAGKALLGSLFPSFVSSGIQSAHGLYKKMRHQKNIEPDKVADFPVLDALAVEPELVRTIEDDILEDIDDRYLAYLQSLDRGTKLVDIKSINDFIRAMIAKDTKQHVVIKDLGVHKDSEGGTADIETPDTAAAEKEFFGAKEKPLGKRRS